MKPETELQIAIDLLDHEGLIPWLYCDKKGFPTIGVGNLVSRAVDLLPMPMFHIGSGKMATDEEKRDCWARVAEAFVTGAGAIVYRKCSDLRISKDYARELARSRVRSEFVPALERIYPAFPRWPASAQRAAVDMTYSLGVAGYVDGYPNHVAACRAGDFARAGLESVRASGRVEPLPGDPEGLGRRNLWTRALFAQAAVEWGAQQA